MAVGSYDKWSQDQLIARIQELEAELHPPGDTRTTSAFDNSSRTPPTLPIPNPSRKSRIPYRKPPKEQPKAKPQPRAFDASRYSTRLIALKFAYLGQKYNGFEHHRNNTTPLPTIEEELWKALVKTRLISPTPSGEEASYERIDRKTFMMWDREGADVNWDNCEYSKCGRTDRGVSAFGQVIGVRVRSNRPLPKTEAPAASVAEGEEEAGIEGLEDSKSEEREPTKPFDGLKDELAYIQLLNRVLPPTIRIYAWCPNPPPNFSARFSCKERRYKYFFTSPSFAPSPGSSGLYKSTSNAEHTTMREGWLDIDKMREACKELVGLHDFRNFCKVDASKQITNFNRRIFYADIEEISPLSVPSFLSHPGLQNGASADQPKTYAFVLHGSAFLWHQVRSIVAILFFIGQGLEPPSLIPSLLDVSTNPTRPKYEMASDAPLVLWDCIFPHEHEVQDSEVREHGYEDRLEWVYVGDEGAMDPKSLGKGKGGGPSTMGRGKWGRGGVIDDVWEVWRANKIDETLAALLLDKIASQGTSTLHADSGADQQRPDIARGGPRVFDGGDVGKAKGNYTPVLQRERLDPVEVVNERYAKRKGLDTKTVTSKEDEADE